MNIVYRKRIALLAVICLPSLVFAQGKPNWQNMDLKTDSVFGISTEKAYNELLPGKKHVPVLVAVIDGGVDTSHEDLKAIIWNNPKEIPNNHIDDDNNGYVDDIHGWDFIGGPNGDINHENEEVTRIVRAGNTAYANADTTKMSADELAKYHIYLKAKIDFNKQVAAAEVRVKSKEHFLAAADSLVADMGMEDPSVDDFKNYDPKTPRQKRVADFLIGALNGRDYNTYRKAYIVSENDGPLQYSLNLNYDPRDIVGDNYADSKQRNYGNNDITGPNPFHGTHVAGIIGAVRDNNIGVKGVANDVVIMSVRTVPDGDERDKDVANAIRYAAANGAKVINMSFGKPYPWDKEAVDEAVKFAIKKDVLIIHAAGNEDEDLDDPKNSNYPNRVYADDKGIADSWIEVGASNMKDNETLKATFSNYGKTSVDVFAPGVRIYSTLPGSKYGYLSGTSMATPVVVGLAALIRSYYPKLTAKQVKEIIMKTVTKVDHDVMLNGKMVPFSSLCQTGGVVNAYNALQLAATYQ
jgi:subtilisin family serine protease